MSNYILKQQEYNEYIYNRNFLLKQPLKPSINPSLIDNQRNNQRNNINFLNINEHNETLLANYWYIYIYNNKKGLNFKNNTKYKLIELINIFGGKRPWLNGVKYNINHSNELLFNEKYLNKRDCIDINDYFNIQLNNTKIQTNMLNKYFTNDNIYPQYTKNWFNNNTKSKILY